MRGNNQEQYLLDDSSSSLATSCDTLVDKNGFNMRENNQFCAYSNPSMFSSDFSEKVAISKSSFQRRQSMQSTSSSTRSLNRCYRRGSIPCLSAVAQNSPQLSPKKSHTAPNPFPELINSPPQTPNVSHRRSRSSNMDDRLWLSPEELDGAIYESDTPLSPDDSQLSDNVRVQHVQNNESPLKLAKQSSQNNVYSSRLSNVYDVEENTINGSAVQNVSQKVFSRSDSRQSFTLPFNGSDYLKQGYLLDRCSPTNTRVSPPNSRHSPTNNIVGGRQSPESQSVIYDQASALVTPHGYTKQMLKVYTDEKNYKTVTINEIMQASEVCNMIVHDSGYTVNKNWSLIEVLPKFDLERILEDHELVYVIYRSWRNSENNRFHFMKDLRKYELFQPASQPFPAHMLEPLETNSPKNSPKIMPKSHHRQTTILLQNLMLDMDKLPDVQSYLYIKEAGKKTWKKHFCVLRKSGFYYSSKGCSKEARHLILISQLNDVNIYTANNAKKKLGAPNNNCFCLKAAYNVNDAKELRLFCAEDEQIKVSWIAALRLAKYGAELKENFTRAVRHEAKLQSIENKEGVHRTYGKLNPNVKSRVAMDFTGVSGRVVADPNEALGVALEEAQHLRKTQHRNERALNQVETMPLHVTQPWFHCSITREHAVHAIHQQGMIDGVFLVRESQSVPGSYVLSMSHGNKVKHCTIKAFEYEGEVFYSMDGGQTKFIDLIQLIEFYQLNTSGLPCHLTDFVNRILTH